MDAYHIVELVGEGSFGRVYKGRKRFTDQVVALKFMSKMGRSKKELQSLKREIEIMRGLEHPNIVQLYDNFETESEVVVVTEYAEGQLFQILEDEELLPESQVQQIACQLVSALYYLHSHRILHRDMKPQNILLGKGGVVKLCDFGFARAMSVSTLVLTSIKGTPLYMCPELVEEKPYDHTADLWSLGCILYELHTGMPPFYANSIFHLVQLIVGEQVKWPDKMSLTCTSFLKGLLTKDPQKRLSWPDVLHHPFVAEGVVGLFGSPFVSPLTITPSTNNSEPSLQQVAAKTVATSGERRLLQTTKQKRHSSSSGKPAHCTTNADSEELWLKLVQETNPCKQQRAPLNYGTIIAQVKVKILSLKFQLRDGAGQQSWQIHHPLKVLGNLLLITDVDQSNKIGCEVGLPHVLLDLVHDMLENFHFNKQPWSLSALGEMMIVLMIFWEKHCDCMEDEHRLEAITKPFITLLSGPEHVPLAPLAACVLSLYTQHDVDVKADISTLTSVMKTLLSDPDKIFPSGVSGEPRLSLPSGWGIFDGLLLLLVHSLPTQHENDFEGSCLDPVLFMDLWKIIGTSLATRATEFFSAKGLSAFLSTALLIFTRDPYSCISLFSTGESKCVYTLGCLLNSDCLPCLAENLELDLSMKSCQLLCFPLALDLSTETMSTVLDIYHSCEIVETLIQVIQTLPPPLLELPLSLVNFLLLSDPDGSVFHLRKVIFGVFFIPASDSQATTSKPQTLPTPNASSLLSVLLQLELRWESAVELLTLLFLLTCPSAQPTPLQLHLDASVLHQALAHSHHQIRAATCRLLGNLDPFRPHLSLQPDILQRMAGCLHDPSLLVQQMACRAVGNWLGYISVWVGFKMGCDNTERVTDRKQSTGELDLKAQQGDIDDASRWRDEALMAAAMLSSLITSSDALIRRHCCVALGNLINHNQAMPLLLKDGALSSLQKVACTDSHHAVREAAIQTLCLYSQQSPEEQRRPSADSPLSSSTAPPKLPRSAVDMERVQHMTKSAIRRASQIEVNPQVKRNLQELFVNFTLILICLLLIYIIVLLSS